MKKYAKFIIVLALSSLYGCGAPVMLTTEPADSQVYGWNAGWNVWVIQGTAPEKIYACTVCKYKVEHEGYHTVYIEGAEIPPELHIKMTRFGENKEPSEYYHY